MSYVPTPREWIEVGAEALKSYKPDWDEHTECEHEHGDDTDAHWACPEPWPGRSNVAMEVIRGLRESGILWVPEELTGKR